MSQDIALLRFRPASQHRKHDVVGMTRSAESAVALSRRCLDERQQDLVLRAMSELLSDMAVAIRQMRSVDGTTSVALESSASTVEAEHERLIGAIRMIANNPERTLRERTVSRRVLKALLELSGTPSTIDEIATKSGLEPVVVEDIMHALHAHGHATRQTVDGVIRHSMTSKGFHPSLSAPNQTT